MIQPLEHFTNQPTALRLTESQLFCEVMRGIMNETRFAFTALVTRMVPTGCIDFPLSFWLPFIGTT